MEKLLFDAIIIGGSYSGLSAGLSLGRALFTVLIIDSGERCNKPTVHSHNLLTHDGKSPADIFESAKEDVLKYNSIKFLNGRVTGARKVKDTFEVVTEAQEKFTSRKLLFTTGVKDKPLHIPGFTECWGNSIHHCPFCHGYEVRGHSIGVVLNGKEAPHISLFHNLSKKFKLFTNGPSTIAPEWKEKITKNNIPIIETEIEKVEQEKGQIKRLVLKDGSTHSLDTLFARVPYEQHLSAPKDLGCTINEMGFIQVDDFQKTNVPGVYAAGDCTTMMRSLSFAIAAGTKAGAMIAKELAEENFENYPKNSNTMDL